MPIRWRLLGESAALSRVPALSTGRRIAVGLRASDAGVSLHVRMAAFVAQKYQGEFCATTINVSSMCSLVRQVGSGAAFKSRQFTQVWPAAVIRRKLRNTALPAGSRLPGGEPAELSALD
jgi:hypothetical protein